MFCRPENALPYDYYTLAIWESIKAIAGAYQRRCATKTMYCIECQPIIACGWNCAKHSDSNVTYSLAYPFGSQAFNARNFSRYGGNVLDSQFRKKAFLVCVGECQSIFESLRIFQVEFCFGHNESHSKSIQSLTWSYVLCFTIKTILISISIELYRSSSAHCFLFNIVENHKYCEWYFPSYCSFLWITNRKFPSIERNSPLCK